MIRRPTINELITIAKVDVALRRLAGLLAEDGYDLELAFCFERVVVTLYHAPGASDPINGLLAYPTPAWDRVQQVGDDAGLPEHWLTDHGKLFLELFAAKKRTEFDLFRPGIFISIAEPRHVLAMKIRGLMVGGWPGSGDDIGFLSKHMGLRAPKEIMAVYQSFFPGEMPPEFMDSILSTVLVTKGAR